MNINGVWHNQNLPSVHLDLHINVWLNFHLNFYDIDSLVRIDSNWSRNGPKKKNKSHTQAEAEVVPSSSLV